MHSHFSFRAWCSYGKLAFPLKVQPPSLGSPPPSISPYFLCLSVIFSVTVRKYLRKTVQEGKFILPQVFRVVRLHSADSVAPGDCVPGATLKHHCVGAQQGKRTVKLTPQWESRENRRENKRRRETKNKTAPSCLVTCLLPTRPCLPLNGHLT